MSNGAVGNLYKRIIDAVLESARTDFEESGVDGRTIDDMREIWQRQLSGMKRAHFPWEPEKQSEATPTAPTPSVTTQSSTVTPAPSKQEPTPAPTLPSPVNAQGAPNPAPIKQESNFDTSFLNLPATGAYNQNPHYAQQRALNNIQQKFGPQAGGSFAPNGVGQNGSPAPQHSPPPTYGQPSAKRVKTEGSLTSSQTDGAGDDPAVQWQEVMAAQAAASPEQRTRADGMLRQAVLQNQRDLEAGGLLLPIKEHHAQRRSQPKDKHVRHKQLTAPVLASNSQSTSPPQPTQLDGADDSDDDDKYPDEEDAINSDLDDSDEENVENALAGDGPEGDTILCLYDKVQRVKNKWKCQLKDGVCTIDGKDYVFHKANGEFEW